MSSRMLVIGAVVAAVLLPGAYLAAGGASYEPAGVQDPCKERAWRNPQGIDEIAEQFTLSALDGAACRLHVTRETLARALATPQSRERFSRRYHISDAKLAAAIRAGVLRAIDDAENAGVLNPFLAVPLRETVRGLPIHQLIELLQDARPLLENAQGFLGAAQGLLHQFLP